MSSLIDSWLTRRSGFDRTAAALHPPQIRFVDTVAGSIRVLDSGSTKPCVVFVPDGPNVIEHYEGLAGLLARKCRIVCFDMPGFGFSLPSSSYSHSLNQGAGAVLAVLDSLDIEVATLAFSCGNGFYALRAARLAPERVSSLFLAQTPSLPAMHAWVDRVIPWPLKVPVLGQMAAWLFRHKAAHAWYDIALPKTTDREFLRRPSRRALSRGACFCLAGVVQGLARESAKSLEGVTTPCTMVWGAMDRSHRLTNAQSLLDCVPHADVVRFEDCGHFPDLEQPQRYANLLIDHIVRHASQRIEPQTGDHRKCAN